MFSVQMSIKELTIKDLAELIGGKVEGTGQGTVNWIAEPDLADENHLTFATSESRIHQLATSRAAVAIVDEHSEVPELTMPLIRVENIQESIAKVLDFFAAAEELPAKGLHPGSTVGPDVQLPEDVRVGPNVSIGARTRIGNGTVLLGSVCIGSDVQIGSDSFLCEGVVVRYGCRIGNRVRIGSNTVIGYDGLGFFFQDGEHRKVTHIGNVVIEDDVEIGACSCVDRAKFGSTLIGTGTKIDNMVQIAHNVQTGKS